ncbi:MAG: HNH endonuclease [Verrucomicrobiae bacterium]|nr:HNH endonuclease [Verrucomicrobiae bacterium]
MPDKEVTCIRDLIFYQYAKLIARSAFELTDGKQAKQSHYGFIKKTFRELKAGEKSWSEITREDWQLVEAEKECIYCGATDNLHREHVVPKSLRIKPECAACDRIRGIHNQVWACEKCNAAKGLLGLYQFYRKLHPAERKFYDLIPPLVEKKYLKTMANCHECAGTLGASDLDGDGQLTVLDIDQILQRP